MLHFINLIFSASEMVFPVNMGFIRRSVDFALSILDLISVDYDQLSLNVYFQRVLWVFGLV